MAPPKKIEKLEELIEGSIVGEIVEQSVEPLVPPGENFGSVIYKVDIKVKNGDKEETYHTVAKCTPPNQVTQEMFNIQVTVKAEIGWYTHIIPTIRDFQRKHGVEPVAEFFQKFYGARISLDPNSDIVDINAVILTENLKPFGYKNADRHIGFDIKTSKSILKNLATLHAVPLAIKLTNKELFDQNIMPYLSGLVPKEDESQKDKDQFADLKNTLREIPEVIPYMDRVAVNLEKNKSNWIQTNVREPWGSISHNDCWVNNIMVTEEDNPKSIFLDFQTASYGSIARDVLFFLSTSVSQSVIVEHMDELIKYYWDEFSRNLEQFKIDDPAFTYEEFLKEFDDAGSSREFGHALFIGFVILMDKGHTDFDSSDENFKKEDLENFKFSLTERHREKFKWLVTEYAKRGWI